MRARVLGGSVQLRSRRPPRYQDQILTGRVSVFDAEVPAYQLADDRSLVAALVESGSSQHVAFTHTLPENTTFESIFPDFFCVVDMGVVNCDFESISGASVILTLEAASIGEATTSASVSALEFDPDTTNNTVPGNLIVLDEFIFGDGFESGDTSTRN